MCYTQESLLDPLSDQGPAASASTRSVTRRSRSPSPQTSDTRIIREALDPYVDLRKLRRLAASGDDLQAALRVGEVPDDVQALIVFVAELLRPVQRDQVKSPNDAAAFLMARLGLLDQEELWTLILNTKNYMIKGRRLPAAENK